MKDFQEEIDSIVDSILDDDVVKAYKELVAAIKNNEPSDDLENKLQGLEGKLIEFASMTQSTNDKQNQEIVGHGKKAFKLLKHEVYALLGEYYLHRLRQKHSRVNAFFEKAALVKDDDVANELSTLLTEDAMLHLQPNLSQEQLLEKECEIQVKVNDYREKVFYSFLLSGVWTKNEHRVAESLFLSPVIDEVSVQLFVSAVTLACFNFFDPRKYLLLAKVYKNAVSPAVKVRALVGLVLCDVVMPKFMEREGLPEALRDLMNSDQKFEDNLLKLQKTLDISVLSVEVCRDMAHKMLGGAMKHMGHIVMGETEEERVKRITSNEDEDAEEAEMQETMDGVMNQEREGYDLYISQFKEISRCNFYKKLYNWFMPFDEQNPAFLHFMAKVPKGREALMMMHDHTEFCDSDLYGFVFFAQKFPEMLDNLWKQLPQDFNEDFSGGVKRYGESRLLRNYVRQLARFYMYGNRQLEFGDPFSDCQSEGFPAYCFLALHRFEEPLFRGIREKAKNYAFNQGSCELLKAFYAFENMENLTVDEHLRIAEVLLDAGGVDNEDVASEHVEIVLKAEPDNMRAHFLTYLNPASFDQDIITSALALLRNQKELMAQTEEEEEDKLTEEDFYDVKIKLMESYIHTRQLEAALKLAYELDYNNPGIDRVNACMAYCLLHRNPIMVSQEQIEKVEKIIDPFLAQDLKSVVSETIKNSLDKHDPKDVMKDLAKVFLKTSQKDLKAECVFDYCKALCALSRHEEDKAFDFLTRGLINSLTKYGDADGFLEELLFPYGVDWLKQFGYEKEDVVVLYQRARIKIMDAGRKFKF